MTVARPATPSTSGKQAKVGKPVMSDLREGKLTLPVIHCMNRGTVLEKRKLKAAILRKVKTSSDLKYLNTLLAKYRAIDYSVQKARFFVDEAKRALNQLNGSRDKNDLQQFADFLIDRDF